MTWSGYASASELQQLIFTVNTNHNYKGMISFICLQVLCFSLFNMFVCIGGLLFSSIYLDTNLSSFWKPFSLVFALVLWKNPLMHIFYRELVQLSRPVFKLIITTLRPPGTGFFLIRKMIIRRRKPDLPYHVVLLRSCIIFLSALWLIWSGNKI